MRDLRGQSSLQQCAKRYGCSASAWQRYETSSRKIPLPLYLALRAAHPNLPELTNFETLVTPAQHGASGRDLRALLQFLEGMPASAALELLDDASQEIDRQREQVRVAVTAGSAA